MKKVILLGVLLLSLSSFGIHVSDLPVCEYADTEVATNLPFRVSLDEMSRVEMSLSLSGNESMDALTSILHQAALVLAVGVMTVCAQKQQRGRGVSPLLSPPFFGIIPRL